MDEDKRKISTTVTGRPVEPGMEDRGVPTSATRSDGQAADHWVLSEEERSKGFVRPVRRSYVHDGARPKHPTHPLTEEQQARYADCNYVSFEEYPESERPKTGRFWTAAQLASGCGVVTSMPQAIAETYARDPKYYGSTFCCGCNKYLPVGSDGEFTWVETDGSRGPKVGT